MNTKQTLVSLIITLLVGAAIGRYSLPTKVVTKTVTLETDNTRKTVDTVTVDHSTTVVTETKKLDGTVVTVTETKKNVDTKDITKLSEKKSTEQDTEKTVTYNTGSWSLNVLAAASVSNPQIVYGGQVEYRLLGPIKVGGFALANGTVGVSLGLQF